ncbi:hypothetical protein BN1708_008587 [Verticillium longisporum]|uniref:Glycoside hydrolase family 93 protein n=1 Tax=Verticillium longisporum TaxID=100787 RepID=A0A0G4N6E0_VERLO|nr:hypothetical protein BN1708_008587 [Verticillium longisporum]
MLRSALFAAVSALSLSLTSALETFDRKLIFQPPSNYTDPRVLYPRTVQLTDGRLLAIWENYSPEPPLVWHPIYESTDGGLSWGEVGRVTDQVNGWGLRYQPFLYELRQDFGGFPAGTVLAASNSIPTDLSQTRIDVYASRDRGRTWEFVSHVASGGRAIPNNEETPVWEPMIIIYEDELILYYADQRSAEHGQEISHQTTKDLRSWSDVVIDISEPRYTDRPGMPYVAKLPKGDYIYAYEWGGADILTPYTFPLYYRIAADPRRFADAEPLYINATNRNPVPGGAFPISSPVVVWSPVGGCHGSIIVSSGSKDLYINTEGGAPDAWLAYTVPEDAAYTRHIRVMEEDPDFLLIMGAGKLPPSTTNKVTVSMVKISDLLKQTKMPLIGLPHSPQLPFNMFPMPTPASHLQSDPMTLPQPTQWPVPQPESEPSRITADKSQEQARVQTMLEELRDVRREVSSLSFKLETGFVNTHALLYNLNAAIANFASQIHR